MDKIQIDNVNAAIDGTKISFTATFDNGTYLKGSIMVTDAEIGSVAYKDFNKLVKSRITETLANIQ